MTLMKEGLMRVMGPFWGTASIKEREGLDFHL